MLLHLSPLNRYEEALKYPYVSTICSNVVMNNSNATILNINGSINDLDNLHLIAQLESQHRHSNILLCTGNCNCLNHLRQSIRDHNSIVNQSAHLPESSSTATTSTINSSNLNTSSTFITTIIDETPTSTNLILETNLNLSNESVANITDQNHVSNYASNQVSNQSSNNTSNQSSNQVTNQASNQASNQKRLNDESSRDLSNQQVLNASNLESIRNSQLNRSSTFSDLQSYLKNFNSR